MPKTKKSSDTSDSDSGPDDRAPPAAKKSKDSGNGKTAAKNDGENKWILEKNRHVTINEFRGRKLIDIREYYEKNGDFLPGKKGISLSLPQWKKLLEVAEEVTKAASD